ncbi:hypothetical protein AAC387_Pa05g0372 [Persea americana]
MCLLTIAVSVPSPKPPRCTQINNAHCKSASTLQLGVFFGALYILAIGTGGTKPNISTIGADQFDDFEPKEKTHKLSFFNWWMFSVYLGTLFGNTALVYIQDNVGWTLGYGLPTLGLLVSLMIFIKYYAKNKKFRIDSTSSLRFLNKAAVKTRSYTPWMLCSITQVEETKQIVRMIPMFFATFISSTMMAHVNTLFVKQGTTLNRRLSPNFSIPLASLSGLVILSMLVTVVIYDSYFVPIMRRWTKNPRGISLLQRMGIGYVMHIRVMVTASFAERRRLSVAKDHGLVENGKQVPLTIFILLPQFVIMGIADAFLEVANMDFFYDQAPEGMKSIGTSYSLTSLGIGNFLSSFLLSTVSHVTKKNGHKGWILDNLNASHLDYYYAFFAALNLLNFLFF